MKKFRTTNYKSNLTSCHFNPKTSDQEKASPVCLCPLGHESTPDGGPEWKKKASRPSRTALHKTDLPGVRDMQGGQNPTGEALLQLRLEEAVLVQGIDSPGKTRDWLAGTFPGANPNKPKKNPRPPLGLGALNPGPHSPGV